MCGEAKEQSSMEKSPILEAREGASRQRVHACHFVDIYDVLWCCAA